MQNNARPEDFCVPDDLQVQEFLGEGRRSWVYRARFRGKSVVVKVYRQYFIEKYRKRYSVDIAQFELDRNTAFRSLAGMCQYTVEPLMALSEQDGHTTAFVQEYVDGIALKDMVRKLGYLPDETLSAGHLIMDTASEAGLHDLDVSMGNIKVVERNGQWLPVIYDFNMMPQHMFPPNPFMALGFRLGLRNKSYRDYRSLRAWKRFGDEIRSSRE